MARWKDDNLLKESRMREWFSPTGYIPFERNPSSGKYDFDGDVTRQMLSNFVAEDGDGFTVDFGKVTMDFDCSGLGLTSLKGAPQIVGGSFSCSGNYFTSLKGAPQKVGGYFNCSDNQLTSLEGAPKVVGGDFNCLRNPNLHSLDGIGEVKGRIIKGF